MMKVYLGKYEHKHGTDVAVYSTEEHVKAARTEIARRFRGRHSRAQRPPAGDLPWHA